jgi:hypothetical protein
LVSEILECTDFEFPALDSKWQPFGCEPNALAKQQVIEDKTVDNGTTPNCSFPMKNGAKRG